MKIVLLWIVFGVIVGWIASLVTDTRRVESAWNIAFGVVGAIVGGMLLQTFGAIDVLSDKSGTSVATALFGAIVLIILLQIFMKRSD